MPAASVRYEAGAPRSISATVPESAVGHVVGVAALARRRRQAEAVRPVTGEGHRAQGLTGSELDQEGRPQNPETAGRQPSLRELAPARHDVDPAPVARQPAVEEGRPWVAGHAQLAAGAEQATEGLG